MYERPPFLIAPDDSCSLLCVTVIFLYLGRRLVQDNDTLRGWGEHYPRLLSAQGFGAEVELVRTVNPAPGQRRRVVPEAAGTLLEEFAAYGTAEAVREQLGRWDAAVDITMVGLPPGMPWPSIKATLRAAAPSERS